MEEEKKRITQQKVKVFFHDNPSVHKEVSKAWVQSKLGREVMHNLGISTVDRELMGSANVPKTSPSTPNADRIAQLEFDNKKMREEMQALMESISKPKEETIPEENQEEPIDEFKTSANVEEPKKEPAKRGRKSKKDTE